MDRWEYATFKILASGVFTSGELDTKSFNGYLNQYGEQGWELVNAFDTNSGNGGTKYVVVIMKRKKSSDSQ